MSSKRIDLIVDAAKLFLIVLISCVITCLIVLATSEMPGQALRSFFIGPFTSLRRFANIFEGACPLIFTAMAVMIIFSAKQFSMISEGAFLIGCSVAMVIALSVKLPAGVHPVLAVACAALAGAAVAAVPALLKAKWKVSEVVTSIMLNYIVEFFAVYLVSYHFRERTASSIMSLKFPDSALIHTFIEGTTIHYGIIFSLVLCVGCWLLLYRSQFGYKLRVTGANRSFASYAGLRADSITVGAQVLAGGIAGAGGGVELLSRFNRFKWTTSPGYGWTGIVVALLARNNPLLIPLAACFISYINVGASIMSMESDVSNDMALVLQGIIMLLIASDAMLHRWRQKLVVREAVKAQAQPDPAESGPAQAG